MTTETSNARGEVVAWFPTNAQGEIIRNYGDGSPVYACRTKEEAEQAKRCHLCATGPVIPLYAAPPPAAAQQQGQAVAYCRACQAAGMSNCSHFTECHGATCVTCHRPFNTAPPPSAPVAADWITGDGMQGIKAEAHFLTQHTDETVQRVGRRLIERVDKIIAALAQQPAAGVGEEIMVNAAHDVFTLPLQPSGLSSGPRFVVHVPAPEQQPAAVDEAMVERAWVAFCENNGSARQGIRAALTAALATQHQEPKS